MLPAGPNTSRIVLVVASLALVVRIIASPSATKFDFETLTLSSLKLLGDAHLSNGSFRLTRVMPVPSSGAGRVVYSKPILFRERSTGELASFSSSFSFSVTNFNPSSIGGGLAFLLSSDSDSVGAAGGCLGLCSVDGRGSRFVAIEFDTLMDVDYMDINGNHVGVDLNSVVSSRASDLSDINVDLKSGDVVNAWVDYDGSARKLSVSVSYSNKKPDSPVLSLLLDLDRYVNDYMYVGFSGATQGSTEIHSIDWWSFSSSFEQSLPVISPPTAGLVDPGTSTVHSPSPSLPPVSSSSIADGKEASKGSSSSSIGAVAGVVTASAVFIILSGVLIWVFSKKVKDEKKSYPFASEIIKVPKEFSYKEIKKTTKNFNACRIVGQGAFGTVYKGVLPETGGVVAVKRCTNNNNQGKAEFLSELSIIGTLRHRNLVRLQGWCHEKGEIVLVYDLMPNGSLDKALFEAVTPLSWFQRLKILLGVASALSYLHQECENQVIHRDVKTSNIMLDEGFNAKLGDFGLARQIEHDKSPETTVAAGTMGYLAPEYLLTGRATEKTDVFSYGAVVLEVASGRRTIEKDVSGVSGRSGSLVESVWRLHAEGQLLAAADAKLRSEFDESEMRKVLLIGLACSHPDPLARPSMRTVVQMLVGEAEVPVVPRTKPTSIFTTSHLLSRLQDSVSDCNEALTKSMTSPDYDILSDERV